MKNIAMTVLLAATVTACSSSQTKDGDDVASAEDNGPKTKRVCETIRSNETGARMRRVCKTVVVQED